MQTELNGIINVDKPAGISSAAVVTRVKRLLPKGIRIGHAGTLDPFATGVLLLLVGKATKLCEQLMGEGKEYEATVKLGATTATLDPTSAEVLTGGVLPATREAVVAAVAKFVGEIEQRPPDYSALKIDGRPAYKLARKGREVKLEARKVRVERIDVVEYEWPLVRLRVECGRGTYIRALARDIGGALGMGAYVTELRRTAVGRFRASEAVRMEQLAEEGVAAHLEEGFSPLRHGGTEEKKRSC